MREEMTPARIQVVVIAVLAVTEVVLGGGGKSMTLTLEKASHKGAELSQLRNRDLIRHGRILQQRPAGVVDLPVEGNYDPSIVGLYYTRVQLGSPPKEFYVQIDTGSNVLWVSCNSCNGCPTSSGLNIQLELFDPSRSSTASLISCSDQRCALGAESLDSICSNQNQCGYKFRYGDESGASGYYVSDLMYFDTIVGDSSTSNSSAPVVFGCSTSLTGALMKSDIAVDGIFGFGQQGLSLVSQLFSQGVAPNAFSHCLKGDNGGGGILVLGRIEEPNIVFTPLVPSQPHYNLNLQSISVNGQELSIDPSVFATSTNRGTIVDSGTTLAYLAEEAYDPFITAITQAVSRSVRPLPSKGNQCYLTTSSVSKTFPSVSLNFTGGASMVLRPLDYLLQQNSTDKGEDNKKWRWGVKVNPFRRWKKPQKKPKFKGKEVVVYDLAGQRIGWSDCNCSSFVNCSTTANTGKIEFVNAGEIYNSSSTCNHYKPVPTALVALLLHVLVFGIFTLFE